MKVDWKVVGSIAAVMACRELTLHRQSPAFGHLQMGAGARRSRGIGFGEILLFGAAGILVLKILGNPAHAQQQMQLASTPVPAPAPSPSPIIPRPTPISPQVAEYLVGLFARSAGGSPASEPPVYIDPVDAVLAKLLGHPCIILILGHRGSGKTALAVRIQELLRDVASPYAVGLPTKASKLLPDWYGMADETSTIPNNATIYIPESYRLYHARDTQSAQGKSLGELVNLSRHRRHTLIFDVQNPAHLDRNIVSEADLVLVKEPGPLQQGFERPQYRSLMDTARAAFAAVGPRRKRRAVWVVAPASGVNGQLMDNLLPSFWSDALSRIFGDTSVVGTGKSGDGRDSQGSTAVPRRGRRTPPALRQERAIAMHDAGHSYGEIAKSLGISKSQAYRYVNRKR